MGEFRMPSLGADMDQGTLVEWRVAVGDHVERGDIVASVDTDKAVIDVEVFESGVVQELLVEPGTTVPVGTPLARLGADGPEPGAARPHPPAAAPVPRTAPAPAPAPRPAAAPAAPVPSPIPPVPAAPGRSVAPPAAAAPTGPAAPTGGPGRHHASVVLSPVLRHLAEQLDVDIGAVVGTGPGGRITRADVQAAADGPGDRGTPGRHRLRQWAPTLPAPPAADPGRDRPGVAPGPPGGAAVRRRPRLGGGLRDRRARCTNGMSWPPPVPPSSRRPRATDGARRDALAARSMERSNREIPHFHLATTVDLEPTLHWMEARNAGLAPEDRLIPAVLLLRAAALAARAVPDLNGWWRDDALVPAPRVDLGVAVALRGGGLVTPTLQQADEVPVAELMDGLRGIVERARRGALRSSDLAESSITVTNLGDRGADVVHGVIHPPQVALVGYGRIVTRPWVVDGQVVPRRVVTATLAADHRACDGHLGSRFLSRIDQLLRSPDRLDEPQ